VEATSLSTLDLWNALVKPLSRRQDSNGPNTASAVNRTVVKRERVIVEFGYTMSNNQIFAKGRHPLPRPKLNYSHIEVCSILLTRTMLRPSGGLFY
jgi:hypothetical protein